MRFRLRSFALPSLLFAAACSTESPSSTPGTDDPAPGDGAGQPTVSTDQAATNLGVTIMASDARGVPRLIRSIVPRAGLPGATPAAAARDHIAALAPLWVKSAAPMALVDRGSQVLRNGATVAKLAQQVDGVLLDEGELRVLMNVDGSLAAISGSLRPAIAAPAFATSATAAVSRALDEQYGSARAAVAISEIGSAGGWQSLEVADHPQLHVSDARARKVIATIDDRPTAAWEVEVIGDAPADPLSEIPGPTLSAHSYLIHDGLGAVVRDVNLDANDAFVYRVYAETAGNRRPLDGPLQSFAPHPTGVPDGSGPGQISANLVVMEAFNGPGDKWLADNATTTAGNNAEAFSDLDGNNQFTPGDIRPEVKSGRILNYTYHQDQEPLATLDQARAGAVNAFFVVNWMHDWWYDSGFTEATANAQLDNFGRGGVANDRLLIAAQAGANAGSRNNASMATPADGARPRMRMFLWTAGADPLLTGPNGVVVSDTFSAGPRTFTVTGELAIGTDATAPSDDGCQAISGVTGKIALLTYAAQCNSSVTVGNAKAAGAIGVILVDGELDIPRAFGGNAAANLPGLVVGKTTGQGFKEAMGNGPVSVTISSKARGPERDGDLDNGVVAHEWGHYLHHRLAACGASQQCGGMSEGWGDFNALMLMLQEGDNRDGVYAMAPYALNDGTPDTAYFGIRRFPYSRDRTKNDLSFRHIGDGAALPTTTPGFPGGVNSEVHNTGEIWATMMWEVLNVLADEHGVTVARRRMSDYVVAGLLLAPTNATFTEQRDAILAGASALDSDDMLLMAAAFAGRGLGSCAVSPPKTSTSNTGVVESGTIAAKLAPGAATVTDEGTKSDHDGILESGEIGLIHLKVANGGVLAAEQVKLTATSSVPGVTIGTGKALALLPAFSTGDVTLPVTVAASVPNGTSVTFTVHISAEDTCSKAGIDVPVTTTIGATMLTAREGVNASSAIDYAELGAMRTAPATSLREFDTGACIQQDAP